MSLLQDRSASEAAEPPRLPVDGRDRLFPRHVMFALLVVAVSLVGLGMVYGLVYGVPSGGLAGIVPYLGMSLVFAVLFLIVSGVVTFVGRRAVLRDRARTRAIRESLIAVHLAALDASRANPHRAEPARHG